MEPRPNYLVLRRFLEPSKCRYYPYATGRRGSFKETMKEEVVKLGVELSVYVAESMFCLCDDIRTMLELCFQLWRCVIAYQNPVSERLLHVIHYVYSKHIQPKNGVYEHHCASVQWELIRKDFAEGILVFHRLESILRTKDCSFDDRLLSSAIAKYKQVLKKLEDKLRSAKHVSKANGFARDTTEFNISGLWKSFFDEEEAIPEVIRTRILSDMFEPFLSKPNHREILAMPQSSPYILGEDFAMQELKEEVVQLGVELSLLVAQSMFSLCDNIRSVLYFCFVLYRDVQRDRNHGRPVEDRLLHVIYYVYLKYIKPKNQNAGKSFQWSLISTTLENLVVGFGTLDRLVTHVRAEEGRLCREFTSSIEVELNNVKEKLRCADANGYAREALTSNILDLWKSVYDKEAKEARLTLKEIKTGIIRYLFLPLSQQGAPPPPYLLVYHV